MSIEITPDAAQVLRRSLRMVDTSAVPDAGVRLRAAKGLGGGTEIQVELADGPSPGETVVEQEGVRIFVDPSVTDLYSDAVVALEPQHETVVVRPRDTV
ncbi:MAG: hypothetical protein M3N53_03815 [Actinomycetota bacterium]|nr:hypothetical protein [Actinomycetota bacterium]